MAEVKTDHQAMAPASTMRGPYRSASQPPGPCSSEYDQLNADTLQPIVIFDRPNSFMIAGVAVPMTARSMYMMNAMTKVMPSTMCRADVGCASRGFIQISGETGTIV